MNSLLSDLIKQTYVVINDCVLYGLDSGDLSTEDSELSASLIQKNMSQIQSVGELLLFTSDLAKRYSAYQKAFITVKQHSVAEKDKHKLEALQEKLRSFTVSPNSNGS